MKLSTFAAFLGLAASKEHILSLDALEGTRTEIAMEVKDYMIV